MMTLKNVILTVCFSMITSFGFSQTKSIVMFDGKTLKGWEGDSTHWRAENGVIIGEITSETIIKTNTFLIWKGKAPKNFDLSVDYKISAKGNSGVNYRSTRIDSLPFALKGYQADIDGKDKYNLGYPRHTGQNYEERGRQFLATRGQRTLIETGKAPLFIDSTGTRTDLLQHIHFDGWNTLRIVARGNVLQHYINGMLMSEVTDHDKLNSRVKGLIGVQVHVGPPMTIEYKNFILKKL